MTCYHPWLARQGILSSRDLKASRDGQRAKTAGLIAPTAKGYHFTTPTDWRAISVSTAPGPIKIEDLLSARVRYDKMET
jgi:hypothetical protein